MFGYTQDAFVVDRFKVETMQKIHAAVVKLEKIGQTVGVRLLSHVNREVAVDGIEVLAVAGKDSALLVVTSNGATIIAGTQKILVPSVWTETMLADAGIVEAEKRVEAWKKWNSPEAQDDKEQVANLEFVIGDLQDQMDLARENLEKIQAKYAM